MHIFIILMNEFSSTETAMKTRTMRDIDPQHFLNSWLVISGGSDYKIKAVNFFVKKIKRGHEKIKGSISILQPKNIYNIKKKI